MGAGPTAELQVSHEILSEFYLAMWRLLDNLTDENRWLEIRPVDAAVLQDDIRRTIESLSLDPSSTLFSDYQQTQEFLSPDRSSESIDLAGFREYLRDTGLRLAETRCRDRRLALSINDNFKLPFGQVWNVLLVPTVRRPIVLYTAGGNSRQIDLP